jgi:antitoxin component of MazEF toxin-antitoxin module
VTPHASPTSGISFSTTLSAFGNNTGIVVPPEVIEALGGGKRPAVSVDLNGHVFPTTIGVMGGQQLIPVSAAIRKATGLSGGDDVTVTLAIATAPREVEVPADFAAALEANPPTRAFFDALANSIQRFHIDNVNGTKNAETRQRRIDKAVELFLAGKKR